MPAWALLLGRLASSAAVWESRSLPALSRKPVSLGSRVFFCTAGSLGGNTERSVREIARHSVAAASRPAALLLPRILPVLSVVTPCRPGASTASVHQLFSWTLH